MAAVLCGLAVVLLVAFVHASDPEATHDFEVPAGLNVAKLDGKFFTFTGFRDTVRANVTAAATQQVTVLKATVAEFPALKGLGVSYASLTFAPGDINPLHTHPRGTELLYVQEGSLEVGLVDSTNKFFTKQLQTGDVYVFPKGLVHYQFNSGKYAARAISAFSSASAGTVSLPANLFGSTIPQDVLTKAFKVSPSIVQQLTVPFKKQK